jgi:hypothetical protein
MSSHNTQERKYSPFHFINDLHETETIPVRLPGYSQLQYIPNAGKVAMLINPGSILLDGEKEALSKRETNATVGKWLLISPPHTRCESVKTRDLFLLVQDS